MFIDLKAARLFIAEYTKLLGEVHQLTNGKKGMELMSLLASARASLVAEPSLLDTAASNLEADGDALSEEFLEAMQSLQVRRWIYLRDTTKYSVFIDPEGEEAYAVLGLTQRVRDIIGGTGVILQTGICPFQEVYVCDGIVSQVIWLGANYRKDYAELLASLKKKGHFHKI